MAMLEGSRTIWMNSFRISPRRRIRRASPPAREDLAGRGRGGRETPRSVASSDDISRCSLAQNAGMARSRDRHPKGCGEISAGLAAGFPMSFCSIPQTTSSSLPPPGSYAKVG